MRTYPSLLFFFFQAEDGIRDHCVTGVQTCALPILIPQRLDDPELICFDVLRIWSENFVPIDTENIEADQLRIIQSLGDEARAAHGRSEERRVGKECRSRWGPDH